MVQRNEGDPVEVSGTIEHETEKAWLFQGGGPEPVWVPKSLCKWDPETKIMSMPDWIAERGKLI